MTNKVKQTHSLEEAEKVILGNTEQWFAVLKDPNATKQEKHKAREHLKTNDRLVRDLNNKHINGKKYPVKQKPIDISKEDLIKLINDEVPDYPVNRDCVEYFAEERKIKKRLDLSGSFDGKRFVFKELGWPEPKHNFKPQ